MVRFVDLQTRSRLETIVRDETAGAPTRELGLVLSPADATRALRASWAAEMEGREDEAREILKRCRDLGVPLPF